MLTIRRNFGVLLVYIKRSLADHCFQGNKHYDFFIRHIKTDLGNQSYIIKQTTGVPKEIRNLSPTIVSQNSDTSLIPFSKYTKLKVPNDKPNIFLEKNLLIKDFINKLAKYYTMKDTLSKCNYETVEGINNSCFTGESPNKHGNELPEKNKKDIEHTQSNHHEYYVHPNQLNLRATSFPEDPYNYDSITFSLVNIRELFNNKINEIQKNSFYKNDFFSDDNIMVILNQSKLERLLFFKNKDLHIIEFSKKLENKVKNYIKKIDFIRSNKSASERINLIKFSEVYLPDNLFETNSSFSENCLSYDPDLQFSENNINELNGLADSWKRLNTATLKVKKSVPLYQNNEKFWIPYEENATVQDRNEFSPQSGPPFTEKVPIKKDKLIEESVVPNTSILDIINSIDRSAVIIQKDLYITDRIITKIQKEEEEKHRETDKNKLETRANKNYVMHFDAPSHMNGMVMVSLAGLPACIKELSLNNSHAELNIFGNKQSFNVTTNLTEVGKESLPQQLTNEEQITSRELKNNKLNDSLASVTLNSIDDEGKISLNMVYEPNIVVPMLSFFSKEDESDIITTPSGKHSRLSDNNHSLHPTCNDKFKNNDETPKNKLPNENIADHSQSQQSVSLNNNVDKMSVSKVSSLHQKSFNQENSFHITQADLNHKNFKNRLRLLEKNFLHKKAVTNQFENIKSKPFKEDPMHTTPENKPQRNSIKAWTPQKKIFVYDFCEISPGEGVPVDAFISDKASDSQKNNTHLRNINNSPIKHIEKESGNENTFCECHIPNQEIPKFNKSSPRERILNLQNSSNKQLLISKEQTKNELLDLANAFENKKSPQTLSGDIESFAILNNKKSFSNNHTTQSEYHNSESLKEDPYQVSPYAELKAIKLMETLIRNLISNKKISVPIALNNKLENQHSDTPKEKNNIQLLEKKENNILGGTSETNGLINKSLEPFSKTTQEEPKYMTQKDSLLNVIKLLETLVKNYIPNEDNSISDNIKNISTNKYLKIPKDQSVNSAQNLSLDILISLDKFLKECYSKKKISFFEVMENKFEQKCTESLTEESMVQNSIIDVIRSLQRLNARKEKPVSNNLEKEINNYSEIPSKKTYHRAHQGSQVGMGTLISELKDDIPRKGSYVSNDTNNVYKGKKSDTALEETCSMHQNRMIKLLDSLLQEYFTKAGTSQAKLSEKIMLKNSSGYQNETDSHSEENSDGLSNPTNAKLGVTEKVSRKHEKQIHENRTKKSELYEELFHNFKPNKNSSVSKIICPDEVHKCVSKSKNTETKYTGKKPFQNKNKIISTKYKKLSKDKIQGSNKYQHIQTDNIDCTQFHSSEANNESILNKKDAIDTSGSKAKEESDNEKGTSCLSVDQYLNKESDVVVQHKNDMHPNLSHIPNNELEQPASIKSLGILSGNNSVSESSGKGTFTGRKNYEKLNKLVPPMKQFKSSNKKDLSVDCVKKTTISTVEKNNFTDINVSEVETYVDSRLPIPFSTETFFQIFGSNHFLREHSYLIDVTKCKLTSANKVTDQPTNLKILAKLDDIQKRIQHLNIIAMNSKSSSKENTALKNEAVFPSKQLSESSANIQSISKHGKENIVQSNKTETSKKRNGKSISEENVSNKVPKFSLKFFRKDQQIKAHNFKEINKQNMQNQKKTPEIKKKSSQDEKSLLIVESMYENTKEIKMDNKKSGKQKVAMAGIKESKSRYIDLFNFNKNENNSNKVQGHKKGVYDHRGLSKRDKKILQEITKEIPKKKSKRRSSRKLSNSRKKSRNENEKPVKSLYPTSKDLPSKETLPKKGSVSVNKTILSNSHLSNKQKLLPHGKNDPEKLEVQKTFTNKLENTTHKIIPNRNKKSFKSELEKDIKPADKTQVPESKPIKVETTNAPKTGNLKQVIKSDKISLKNSELKQSKNFGEDVEKASKPLCQTYVATETYISQPEKSNLSPEKILTSKKISKSNPTQQKVTILENVKTNKEDSSAKIHEGFKEELIKKSQKTIEHKTNIDFRVKTPKLKNPKSKVTFKSKQKGKPIPVTVSERTQVFKKNEKKYSIKNQQLVTKKHVKNRQDSINSIETGSSKKISTPKKSASLQNIKNEELNKINQPETHKKEALYQPESKNSGITNTKSLNKIAKGTEEQVNEQSKSLSSHKLKPPIEPHISKTGPLEYIDKNNFPILLIDVDKMSKEIKPELDLKNCKKCQVADEKLLEFPLHNQKKKLLFKPPFKILNFGPSNDPMLQNELKLFPSVTKILNSTIPEKSREILREWRKNMINELGENGFKSFYRGQLINGSKFNWQLHNFLVSGEKHKQDSNNLSLKSIENILGRTSDLCAINTHVIHRKLAYRGVIDCVAKYQKRPVLIEWKRLESPRVKIPNSSIDVAATQLSAYVGALNYDETYKFQISGGLIVLAYSDGSEAEVIEINNEQCYKHWKMWLRRLQMYHESSKKTVK